LHTDKGSTPSFPKSPARNQLPWPGEHPSLVSLYSAVPCYSALQSCDVGNLSTTLFDDFSNVSFSCPILKLHYTFLEFPCRVRAMSHFPSSELENFNDTLSSRLFPSFCHKLRCHPHSSFGHRVIFVDFDRVHLLSSMYFIHDCR
jgi:hypothetical protein